MFVKPLSHPVSAKGTYYTKRQEALRKDIERCFGVLLKGFHILANPARCLDENRLHQIWKCCIILHNLILEHDGLVGQVVDATAINLERGDTEFHVLLRSKPAAPLSMKEYLDATTDVRSQEDNIGLRDSLIDHLWAQKGNE